MKTAAAGPHLPVSSSYRKDIIIVSGGALALDLVESPTGRPHRVIEIPDQQPELLNGPIVPLRRTAQSP
jgi:hypothetical protein